MSDAAAAAPDTPEDALAPPAPKGGKLLPILLVFNSLLLVGVMAFLVLNRHPPAPPPEGKHEAAPAAAEGGHGGAAPGAHGVVTRLGDFVIHLRNPEVDRYARLSFDLEVAAEADKEKVTAALPKVRDAFIAFLSDRTLEELQGSDGLARMKGALMTKLRELVPGAAVRELYVTEFVIQ